MSKRAEEKAVEYQIRTHGPNVIGGASLLSEEEYMRFNMNLDFKNGYEQAEKDIKEAIVKHFKYKQDHSPEHTLHWWVYKNVIDKVNEL